MNVKKCISVVESWAKKNSTPGPLWRGTEEGVWISNGAAIYNTGKLVAIPGNWQEQDMSAIINEDTLVEAVQAEMTSIMATDILKSSSATIRLFRYEEGHMWVNQAYLEPFKNADVEYLVKGTLLLVTDEHDRLLAVILRIRPTEKILEDMRDFREEILKNGK